MTLEPEVSMSSIFSLYFNDIFAYYYTDPLKMGAIYPLHVKKKKQKNRIINDTVICTVAPLQIKQLTSPNLLMV